MNTIGFDLWIDRRDPADPFVVPRLLLDDAVAVDFTRYALDLRELQASCECSGEFALLTCWCGVPDCVGIRAGIEVRQRAERIVWHATDPLPRRTLEFDRADYVRQVQALIAAIPAAADELRSEGLPADIVPAGCEPFLLGALARAR